MNGTTSFMTVKDVSVEHSSTVSLRKVGMLSKKLWCLFKDRDFELDQMRSKSKDIKGVT